MVFCENPRFSAKICHSQEKRKSAKIFGNLRKIANPAPFVQFRLSLVIPLEPERAEKIKVPQRTCAKKILPNFRVNFLVRFASKPLFYWVLPSNCSENYLVLFVRIFWLWGCFFCPLSIRKKCHWALEDFTTSMAGRPSVAISDARYHPQKAAIDGQP